MGPPFPLRGSDLAGKITIIYADGHSHTEYIRAGVNVDDWRAPHDSEYEIRHAPKHPERMQVAWRGTNDKCGNVGIYVVRFTQPYPDRAIRSFEFKALDTDTKWMILGITLSDGPEFLPPWSEISYGMPDKWGAASLVFALLEGLGGVKDLGIAFDKSRIAPRWSAAGVNRARVAVRYPASRGSVRYDY